MRVHLLTKVQLSVINKQHFRYPLAIAEKGYFLAVVLAKHRVEPKRILDTLAKKELRKPLSRDSILSNLKIADEARRSGAENLHYQEEIGSEEMMQLIGPEIDRIPS